MLSGIHALFLIIRGFHIRNKNKDFFIKFDHMVNSLITNFIIFQIIILMKSHLQIFFNVIIEAVILK